MLSGPIDVLLFTLVHAFLNSIAYTEANGMYSEPGISIGKRDTAKPQVEERSLNLFSHNRIIKGAG